jgi:uncharacterized protein YggE
MKRLGLLLLLVPLWAPLWVGAAQPEGPVLTVTGNGEVRVAPDMVVLHFGAVAEARKADEAQEKANRTTGQALAALERLGIAKERIATETLRLDPVYSRPNGGEPHISGYRATHTLRVELEAPERAGEVVDAVTGSGANQLQSLEFGLRDGSGPQRQALQKAAADGRAKAQALAEALGLRLGGLLRVTEAPERGPVPVFERARAVAASSAPVQPGLLTIRGSVTLEFAGEPR